MKPTRCQFSTATKALLFSIACSSFATVGQSADPNWGKPAGEHRIHPKAVFLEGLPLGPFANLPNGDLVTVEDAANAQHAMVSSDDGKTWKKFPIFTEPDKFRISYERALTCTREGTVIVSFMNLVERAGWNWQADIHDSPGAKLPNYVVRSIDGGRTWETPQKMHDDWTGAIRDMIQLKDGSVVFTSQMMLHNPGRHAVLTYSSDDQGKTWKRSNIVDLGGIGHHDGAIEASLLQRRDQSLWMLMRTNWGRLWQAESIDRGSTWRPIGPTELDASAAPPILERLSSGRVFLAWNRFHWAGTEDFPAAGGDRQWSGTRTSNNRQELSIAFSEDDGKTWSKPVVVATVKPAEDGRYPRKEISYPYVFERRPGEIWLTCWRFGGFRARLNEKDFVSGQDDEGWKSLFNGKDLTGWHRQKQRGQHGTGGHWGVTADGVLFGEQDPPGSGNGGLLLTDQTFSEFELEVSLRPDWGPDSGVFVRTDERGGGWQIYVDHHDHGNVGHVRLETKPYSVPFRPWGFSRIDPARPALEMAVDTRTTNWPAGVYEESCTQGQWLGVWKTDDWNHLRIRCTGADLPVIDTWVNGLKVCRFNAATTTHPKFDPERAMSVVKPAGSIGLQVHGGKNWQAGDRVFWKDLRIREIER